jgi:hypothetical protein
MNRAVATELPWIFSFHRLRVRGVEAPVPGPVFEVVFIALRRRTL